MIYKGTWSELNGQKRNFWIKDKTGETTFVYYEQIEGEYTGVIYNTKTFSSTNIKHTKDPQQSCLVAKPSETTNTFNAMDYDCSKTAYALCRMFIDPSKSLSLIPPPPPIFHEKTELPNFNCYLEHSEERADQDSPSGRKKRQFDMKNENNKTSLGSSAETSNEKTDRLIAVISRLEEDVRVQVDRQLREL